jgi:hypothetical protein
MSESELSESERKFMMNSLYGKFGQKEGMSMQKGHNMSEREWLLGPIPMILFCPLCHARHLDEGEFATKPHHTHACQACGFVWRPAVVPTVGVQYLPGFKNA